MSIKLTKNLMAVTAGSMLAAVAIADTFTVDATVSNAITLTETVPFSMGTVFLKGSLFGESAPTLTIPANGTSPIAPDLVTLGTGSGKIILLGGQSAGEIAISGAANFTDLAVTPDTNTAIELALVGGSPSQPKILLSVTVDDTSPTTDGAGTATLAVGGTFTLPVTAVSGATSAPAYLDGNYTGSYDIDVAY